MTAQDGEGLVTEEMIGAGHAAMRRHWRETGGSYTWDDLVRAVLTAVAPDIAAEVRRQCAAELLQAIAGGYVPSQMARLLAARWSATPDA